MIIAIPIYNVDMLGGGIKVYVYNLLHSLSKLKKHEYLIYQYSYVKDNNIFKEFNIRNIPSLNILQSAILFRYLTRPFVFLKDKIDILHQPVQSECIPPSFLVKYKIILTILDLNVLAIPSMHSKRWVNKHIALKKVATKVDKIITISLNSKYDIIKYLKVPEEKITVIYLGVSEIFKPLSYENNVIKKKYNINSKYILYIGDLSRKKNIPTVIKAFYKIKKRGIEHKFVIIGRGLNESWGDKKIFETLEKFNLRKDVIIVGQVPDKDLVNFYNDADLFVYPSLYEGFGLPPLEAMACGTPVITSNTSSLPEVVGDAGIMIDPYDVDGFANAMFEVLTNDGLRDDMIKKGLERAKMFSWERTAKETLKVYEEVS